MKKNLLLKFGLIVFSLGGFGMSFTSAATMFHLTGLEQIYGLSPDRVVDNMMYVHFADNGNDFGGFLYFSDGIGGALSSDNTEMYTVETDSNTQIYECRNKVRGFYYNAQRGERLWPLDDKTWKNLTGLAGLETTGGIYTVCADSGYSVALEECENGIFTGCSDCDYNVCAAMVRQKYKADGYGYYGSLQHNYSGMNGTLTIGVDYDTSTGFISIKSGSDLDSTFVRLDNKFPVGFIYDTNGGIGLAGCRFESGLQPDSMKKLVDAVQSGGLASVFWYDSTGIVYRGNIPGISGESLLCNGISLEDTLLKIVIEGIMGVTEGGIEGDTKFGAVGNSSSTRMQYFGTKSVSDTTMMNYARRRAALLCRGKWLNDFPSNLASVDEVICLNSGGVNVNQAENAKELGKTLIVKNGDVTIRPITTGVDNKYHDIFILDGNLLIDEEDANGFVIEDKGFITGISLGEFRVNALWRIGIEKYGDYTGLAEAITGCAIHETSCESWMDANGDGMWGQSDDFSLFSNCGIGRRDCDAGIGVASVLKGNFIVNGKIKASTGDVLYDKYFIYGKFTTKDTFSSLEDMFSWRCNTEAGSNGFPCPNLPKNPYQNASLVVIDQNYSSPLLQS